MKCAKEDLLVYAVTDRSWLDGKTLAQAVEAALQGGATFVQLREKSLNTEDLLREAREIQELCRRYQVPFVINDNVELACQIGADGVHVGQKDMEAGMVRQLLGPDKILGVSAQTVEQALLAFMGVLHCGSEKAISLCRLQCIKRILKYHRLVFFRLQFPKCFPVDLGTFLSIPHL